MPLNREQFLEEGFLVSGGIYQPDGIQDGTDLLHLFVSGRDHRRAQPTRSNAVEFKRGAPHSLAARLAHLWPPPRRVLRFG